MVVKDEESKVIIALMPMVNLNALNCKYDIDLNACQFRS